MPDYFKTVIYKIFCKDTNITGKYIGSTTNFNKRKYKHKSDCSNENNNLKVYQYIRENGGFENFEMVIIEEYPSDNKKEANKRERFWIEKLKANLNSNIPTRTVKEYHKEKIICECGCEILKKHLKRHQESKKHINLMAIITKNNF